ncbi:inositol 5-phosphatase [Pelomyxa schiedti]|nr:inositol 5-phosphatase [Pelomyxa schiedti]
MSSGDRHSGARRHYAPIVPKDPSTANVGSAKTRKRSPSSPADGTSAARDAAAPSSGGSATAERATRKSQSPHRTTAAAEENHAENSTPHTATTTSTTTTTTSTSTSDNSETGGESAAKVTLISTSEPLVPTAPGTDASGGDKIVHDGKLGSAGKSVSMAPPGMKASLATEEKSAEVKHRLASFYIKLQDRILAHIFPFEVWIGTTRKKRSLEVNLSTGIITRFCKVRHKNKEQWLFSQILQAVRSETDPRKVTLRMRTTDDVNLCFINQVQRERFYGLCWLGQCNMMLTTKMPRVEQVKIFVGTWNMGGAAPQQPVSLWIPTGHHFDIVVVCAQECMYESLFEKVIEHLGADYLRLELVSILTVKMAVFVHNSHIAKIRNIEHSSENTGIATVLGNKGAVAVAFQFHDTSFCFIGSHLAAHQSRVDERNKHFHTIASNLDLGMNKFNILQQFDHVIWCGDLNYRIDLSKEKTLELIQNSDWRHLVEADQLIAQRAKNAVFYGFQEGELLFRPTYKYHVGTRDYDTGGKKKRIPAWCDRVLWKTLPGAAPLEQKQYFCCDLLTSSDHSPVFSVFTTTTQLAPSPLLETPFSITITSVTAVLYPANALHPSLMSTTVASTSTTSTASASATPPTSESTPEDLAPPATDLVLLFRAPFLNPERNWQSRPSTPGAEGTGGLCWADRDIPQLLAHVPDPEYYVRQHLFVQVQTASHIYGHSAIPIGESIDSASASSTHSTGVACKFEVEILRHAYPVGVLRGLILVTAAP